MHGERPSWLASDATRSGGLAAVLARPRRGAFSSRPIPKKDTSMVSVSGSDHAGEALATSAKHASTVRSQRAMR